MEISDLIGYKLVDVNTEQIVVEHPTSTEKYVLKICKDFGDSNENDDDVYDDSGYVNVDLISVYDKTCFIEYPIITAIKTDNDLNDYGDVWSSINLEIFGENDKLVNLFMEADSETGFGCNASVYIVCDELDINQLMVYF